jgi:Cof subfamily protein (haloacid dehalogenase superfamily)
VLHNVSIRLVAIDLDGTLLNDSKQVSDQTADALCGLPERGVKVVIASARPPRSVRHVYQSLRLDTWQINYNGALIWDEPARRVVFHQPMSGQLVRRLIDLARSQYGGVLVSCEVQDRWLTDRFDPAHRTETARLFQPDRIAGIEELCAEPVTKLLLQGEPDALTHVSATLSKLDAPISIVQTEPNLLQITDASVSKAAALRIIAEHYGVPMDRTMAIGDALNDVAMLQSAGVAVAMDNAAPQVKTIADWIAPSNNDHGVHAALKRFGLC